MMEGHGSLRIGFVHPDLGIGGAEKLIVDAAVSLKDRGHQVVLFTSRHDPKRCFKETSDGTLEVHVLGDSPIPRTFLNSFHIVCAILRQLHLTFLLLASIYLPFRIPYISPLARLEPFDVFIVDQLSVCVPLLRWFGQTRIVFYCHFPDKLLAGGKAVEVDSVGRSKMNPRDGERRSEMSRPGILKRLYRLPFDKLEEYTTGEADIVLANSQFTSRVYARAFPSLSKGKAPKVVYPCIKIEQYAGLDPAMAKSDKSIRMVTSQKQTFVSLNRFEAKKNIQLAVEAYSLVKKSHDNVRLVVAGGYDKALKDNVDTYNNLVELCNTCSLSHVTLCPSDPPEKQVSQQAIDDANVVFLLNFTDNQRTTLLTASSSVALLYTPQNEHFGIVPIEAMACGLPVLGINSGGPTETIIDTDSHLKEQGATGLLRRPDTALWAEAMSNLLNLSPETRAQVAQNGKTRVQDHFSSTKLGKQLELACQQARSMGNVGLEDGLLMIIGGVGLMTIMLALSIFVGFLMD